MKRHQFWWKKICLTGVRMGASTLNLKLTILVSSLTLSLSTCGVLASQKSLCKLGDLFQKIKVAILQKVIRIIKLIEYKHSWLNIHYYREINDWSFDFSGSLLINTSKELLCWNQLADLIKSKYTDVARQKWKNSIAILGKYFGMAYCVLNYHYPGFLPGSIQSKYFPNVEFIWEDLWMCCNPKEVGLCNLLLP